MFPLLKKIPSFICRPLINRSSSKTPGVGVALNPLRKIENKDTVLDTIPSKLIKMPAARIVAPSLTAVFTRFILKGI